MMSQDLVVMPTSGGRICGGYRRVASWLTFAEKPSAAKRQFVAIVVWLASAISVCAASTIQFGRTPVPISLPEDWGDVVVSVQRLGDIETACDVDVSTIDGTALAGSDYTAASGTLHFQAGKTNADFRVTLFNDARLEPTERFQIKLSNPSAGAVLGGSATVPVSIIDNDTGLRFGSDKYMVDADAGAVTLVITRGPDENFAGAVDYATSDLTALAAQDYAESRGTLAFAADERRKVLTIPVANSAANTNSRSFKVTLSNPVGPTSLGTWRVATVNIIGKGLSFDRSIYEVTEDAAEARVIVTRPKSAELSPTTIDYFTTDANAIAGIHYLSTAGTLHFGAGELRQSISIPLLNNGLPDGTKAFGLTLTNPSATLFLGTPSFASVRILDNDPGVGFERSSYSVWRNAAELTVHVLRGNDQSLGPLTVDYTTADGTGRAGQDYQPVSGTLAFNTNETIKSITVPILQTTVPGDRRFRLNIANVTGVSALGLTSATVDILDLRVATGSIVTVAPPFEPALKISQAAPPGSIALRWNGPGRLQRSDSITSAGQSLSTASSPAIFRPSALAGFFRIEHPRPAALFAPSGYDPDKALPLVVFLHGYMPEPADDQDWARLAPLAETEGFLYCFPFGTVDKLKNSFWNATDACCDFSDAHPDDSGYLRALIEGIAGQFSVDRKRISVVGVSNGGFMAYRMACDHADLISAIVSITGMTFLLPDQCVPSQPVHILHIQETEDPLVQYTGGALGTAQGFASDRPPFPGALESVLLWARYNGCSEPVTDSAKTLDLDLDVPGLDTFVTRFHRRPAWQHS